MASDKVVELLIDQTTVTAVYDDCLVPITEGAKSVDIYRASHVEPAPGGGWSADMRPSGGPVLMAPDGRGFPTRQAALDAERQWLRDTWGI